MNFPNFLIIGAPRSGTSMLYESIRFHPEIFMSTNKEPLFFGFQSGTGFYQGPGDLQPMLGLDTYRSLFGSVKDEKAIGEASTLYLYNPHTPQHIMASIPGAKLIAILRNPVDRAFSHFYTHRLDGREPLTDFAMALSAEEARMQAGWSPFWFYKHVGYYSEQIARYLSVFDREQLRFFLYDDLVSNPSQVFRSIFEFLGVNETFPVNTTIRFHPSGIPKNRALHRFLVQPVFLKRLFKPILPEKIQQVLLLRALNINLARPVLDAKIRRSLLNEYRIDILKTQDLIGRDLGTWLQEDHD